MSSSRDNRIDAGIRAYNPLAAVQYANTYWNRANPSYRHFEDDCTNFISQCLHAGGLPMAYSSSPSRGWWYRRGPKGHTWSYSWSVAHAFHRMLLSGGPTGRCRRLNSPYELQLGDVICYDFEGDGRWNHNTIVTAFDASGQPLVTAHTYNTNNRSWEYFDSAAYTPRIRYDFFHIS
ncbi:MAG: amidase domain-containing protein [Thermoactinomyces sp.]